MRTDFVVIGLILMLFGAVMAFVSLFVAWALAVGALSFLLGLVYLYAGFVDRSATPAPLRQPAEPERAEGPPSEKTGAGWHCTWCWAPLEKGSRYCNACGHRIE